MSDWQLILLSIFPLTGGTFLYGLSICGKLDQGIVYTVIAIITFAFLQQSC